MAADQPIVSERLILPLLTASRMERIVGGQLDSVEEEIGVRLPGWGRGVGARLVDFRLRQVRAHPEHEPWLLRPIGLRSESPFAVGLVNFHGPPDDRGYAEIGYGLDPEHRGRGYAIEAVRAMFDWAAREHGVTRFRASIAPDNQPSMNLIRKLGMVRVGAQWDELDGLELIWTVDRWERRPRAG